MASRLLAIQRREEEICSSPLGQRLHQQSLDITQARCEGGVAKTCDEEMVIGLVPVPLIADPQGHDPRISARHQRQDEQSYRRRVDARS